MNNLCMVIDATIKGNFSKLTRHRMPGAIPFGAKYRLIDFTLSNCKNSLITNVAIFPYGNYRSLSDHIGSGDRWDLNRRRDGIFILPPKNLNLTVEDSVSFQRMYEHIEYFNRSNQEYVIVTPANIVWNTDYQVFLHSHLTENADITEVLSIDKKRLKTYIISKKLLLEYILNYDSIQYRNLSDVFDFAPGLKRNPYIFESACFYVDSPYELYVANMQLLLPQIRSQLFHVNRPILSKETMSAASRYSEFANVKNSIIASGAVIEGTVINSVIGRKAHIRKGATILNSVIMNQCDIESNALIEFAILDKETKVLKDSKIKGSIYQLFVSEKNQIVASDEDIKVLQITAECWPFIKTGGLADVVGGLAEQFSSQGILSAVMIPLYPRIKEKYSIFMEMKAEQILIYAEEKYKVTLYVYNDKTTTYYFIESYDFFERAEVYGYDDDGDRFAFFSKAAIAFLDVLESLPDVIHLHDWHMGLIPLLLREEEKYKHIKTLLTIHNIEYQGIHESEIIQKLGIKSFFPIQPKINFMELGISMATKISTVSETYKDELKYEYYSKNLVDIINRRERDLYGILNGLNSDIGPKKDLVISQKYNIIDAFDAKPVNKLDLQKRMNLKTGNDFFVLGMVTRIVEQKGFDILIPALYEALQKEHIQFVILGTGKEPYIERLKELKLKFPDQVALNLEYDATEPSYIYAGSDAFLMPSRYEPCGIGQMIALRYGTIPIVRQTGGLNDTIDSFDFLTKRGNGFKFYNYDSRDLLFQIKNACQLFLSSKRDWNQLIINAMNSRFSLQDSAKSYIDLYRMMLSE
ncbi:MAG: glycogen/starch synthase [Firmicutes bacterium]|nr:glycogen/starch synthase [Bacillota bacterium]